MKNDILQHQGERCCFIARDVRWFLKAYRNRLHFVFSRSPHVLLLVQRTLGVECKWSSV
jgi:hypothetical protein